MSVALTFLIPVRHQNNAKDWGALKKNLTATVRSISSQDSRDWQAIIVANRGSDLPDLPANFDVCWVDFPPNENHEKGTVAQEVFHESFRFDKGRRVLAGLLYVKPQGHIMIVDDDDFVSNKLASFVAKNAKQNGWYIKNGYVWAEGDKFVYTHRDFSHLCGTSHIIRADLYQIPGSYEEASDDYIRRMLGSHVFMHPHLDAAGTPITELPFVGAIYRVGHSGAHSKSSRVLDGFVLKKGFLKRPKELFRNISNLRSLSSAIQSEFFGAS